MSVTAGEPAHRSVHKGVGRRFVEGCVACDESVYGRSEDHVDNGVLVDVGTQLTTRDTAVQDRPYQFTPRGDQMLPQFPLHNRIGLALADKLCVDATSGTREVVHHPA